MAVTVTGAQHSDLEGGKALLSPLKERFPRMKLVWGDSHYGGEMRLWAKLTLGWMIQTIKALTVPKRGVLVSEGEEVEWEKLFPSGFRPLPRRWVVERSIAWLTRWRRLCRDHEGLPSTSEAFIMLSAIHRMLTTLAPAHPSQWEADTLSESVCFPSRWASRFSVACSRVALAQFFIFPAKHVRSTCFAGKNRSFLSCAASQAHVQRTRRRSVSDTL